MDHRLKVCDPAGRVTLYPLDGGPVVVGRSRTADVLLRDPRVSRRHAELWRDESGRWRVRDLESRNGVWYTGHRVEVQVLDEGEAVELGGYTVAVETAPLAAEPEEGEAAPRRVTLLEAIQSPCVQTPQLMAHMQFGRRLLEIEDEADRRLALCTLMIGDVFGGQRAGIYRLPAKGPLDRAVLIPVVGPVVAAGAGEAVERFRPSPALLEAVRDRSMPGLSRPTPGGGAGGLISIACPLRETSQFIEVLHAVGGLELDAEGWLAMAMLVSEELGQAELAWEARLREAEHVALQRELERARSVQMGLVPTKPRATGMDLAVGFEPCRGVAGDYVDVIELGEDRVLLVVADVCGKGMQAALIAAAVRTFIHAVSGSGDIEDMVTRLNRHLLKTLPQASFVTLAAVLVDTASGLLRCINAGHPPPLMVGRDGVERLPSGCHLPLGVTDHTYTADEVHWRPGDWLAFYTDGLIEARGAGGDMVGIAGLCQRLVEHYGRDLREAVHHVLNTLHDGLQGHAPEDDWTLLLAQLQSAGDVTIDLD